MKHILILITVLVIMSVVSSCTKNEENNVVPGNCVVKLVKNINPLVTGDTLVMETAPGTILQNVPVLTKPGKTFGGWFTDQSQIAASAFDITTTPIYLDKILYAKWN